MSDWTIDRRAFLEHATVGGSVAALGPGLPALARGVSRPRARVPAPFELEEVTIAELQAGLESGKYTARSLVAAYLQRIEDLDGKGPALRAVLEANPDALAQAGALDAERKAKGARGPLHGVPVLVKDNVATRDRMQSTAGSLALVGAVPPRDAFLVQRLERARRSVPQSLRARPDAIGVELRLGCRRVGEPLRGGNWNGDRRLDRLAVHVLRYRRDQADARSGEPDRRDSNSPQSGHGRPHGTDGGGRGDPAGRAYGGRPARRGERRERRPLADRVRECARPRRLEGRAPRRVPLPVYGVQPGH